MDYGIEMVSSSIPCVLPTHGCPYLTPSQGSQPGYIPVVFRSLAFGQEGNDACGSICGTETGRDRSEMIEDIKR